MRALLPILLFCCLSAASVSRAQVSRADLEVIASSVRALDNADVEAAERSLNMLSDAGKKLPEARFQRGMVDFHLGRYEAGTKSIEQAIADAPKSPHLAEWRALYDWVKAARDITKDFAEAKSSDGRYTIRYEKGIDQVLVAYALDALSKADRAIEKHLGIHVPGPIRLEVYPSARSLASVSSLSLENIETSGTVALCKWNRLMIASPRSLLYGYPWLDTINHELVHLALTRASKHQAPVWFHEGLAKLYERSWRGLTPAAYLQPATAGLLSGAAHGDKLIAFDRMHPSIAMLPSQEEAALAFAQVVTFLERFRKEQGDQGLARAINAMAEGRDARVALAEVAGKDFAALEKAWQEGLRSMPALSKPSELKLRFIENAKDADESLDVTVDRARKHLRIGDMLWGRGRKRAAEVEYTRARKFAPTDPILASRVARASLSNQRPKDAVPALDAALADHPSHAPLHALRGEALLALGEQSPGLSSMREALRLNPFDPTPHCELARLSSDRGEQARERASCVLLGGPPAR